MGKSGFNSIRSNRNNILKKFSGTVAIIGSISVLQRKAYNFFLSVARKEVQKRSGSVVRGMFVVSLDEVERAVGLRNENNLPYKTEIKGLMTKIVEYKILKKDGNVEGAFPLLSWVEFRTTSEGRVMIEFDLPSIVIDGMVKNSARVNAGLWTRLANKLDKLDKVRPYQSQKEI